jgi:uncharacterized protein
MPNVDSHAPGTPAWMDLMTDSPEEARKFYGALLGWTFEVGGSEVGNYSLALRNGRAAAGVGGRPPDAPYPNVWSVFFGVKSVDEAVEQAKALGGQQVSPAMDIPDAGRLAMIADPTGAVVGLWEAKGHPGAQIVDEPGAMTWFEVNTRDAEKARDFYARLFALEAHKLDAPGLNYFTLQRGPKSHCGVLQMNEQWPKEIPAHWMGYFAVEDTDAAVKKVQELGGKMMVPPFDSPYGRISVVQDPQGATFSVIKLSQLAQSS